MKRLQIAVLLGIAALCTSSCRPDPLEAAKSSVRRYFDLTATHLYSERTPDQIRALRTLFHPDFAAPGAEGFRKTVIRRPVEITEAKSVSGDYDIIKPHTEDAIEVSVVVHQTYRIADDRVEKVVDDIRMRFILSNGGIDSGKYLILFIYRPTEDDIVYEDIVRSEVRQSSNGDLRGALTAAGMDGLGP